MSRKPSEVRVFAPATVANLACGFDIMGLALDCPGDEVVLTPNATGRLYIRRITGDGALLSRDPHRNTVTVSIASMLESIGSKQGFDVVLKKRMPLGSGLGSSAASSAAGVVAANAALGRPYTMDELVPFAMEGERVACGAAHPDNVAPCLMGGIVLCHPSGALQRLPVPTGMYVVVLHPHVELLTRVSRAVLPKAVPLKTAIAQWANTAMLTAAFYENDFSRMHIAMQDLVAEPVRGGLIPGFSAIKNAAMEQGAIACSISGSGPSVFAIAKGKPAAEKVAMAMQQVCRKSRIACTVYVSKVNKKGTRVLK
jgi:homoserine kinase